MSNKQMEIKSVCSVSRTDRNSLPLLLPRRVREKRITLPSKTSGSVLRNGVKYYQSPRALKQGMENGDLERKCALQNSPISYSTVSFSVSMFCLTFNKSEHLLCIN
jgi:hypothetical protein